MSGRRSPWLASWLLTGAVLLALILMPAAWWEAIWPDGRLRERHGQAPAGPAFELVDLETVAPPPVVLVVDEVTAARPEALPPPDPAWWTRAWDVRLSRGRDLVDRAAAAPPGPLDVLRQATPTVASLLARPDSTIEARLWQLVLEQELGRSDWNGWYTAVARGRAYVDMKRREAAMFDEFGLDQIRVPD